MELTRMRAPRRRRTRRTAPILGMLFMLILLSAAAGAAYAWWERMQPNRDTIVPDYGAAHPVFYNGEQLDGEARVRDANVLLPLDMIRAVLGEDVPIRYEADSESIIMTTADKVVRLKTAALTAEMNGEPFDLTIAAEVEGDVVYLPLAPVTVLYGLTAEVAEETGIVTLLRPGQGIQNASVTVEQGAAVRSEPTIKAPIIETVPAGGDVRIWREEKGWYRVQTASGHAGYAAESDFTLADFEIIPEPEREDPFLPWPANGRKINLTWEAVYQVPADPSKIGPMPGVNVVSPTWFELKDGSGAIRSKADPAYVSWAHKRGYQVWALWSNGFDPDRTTEALSTYATRLKMIRQLLVYAETYKLQGINIDFENVYTKDKENLVQFVREFVPLAHEQGLVVSIDVTPKSNSEMWSAFLDRKALGKVVDYMIVMTYDEHWASSPKAGSVSSLPWVERSIKRILEEDGVPPSKLIMGIPLYTRVWTEKKKADGSVEVSSRALGMEAIEKLIRERGLKRTYDDSTGQNYVEYETEEGRHRIWIEDETSIKARAELARKYKLAGVATWQRGFQKPEIWQVLHDTLEARP
ncbi:Glycoside hydrolase family 18, spore_hydrolase Cortical fragment-lytic enzyme, yvbX [Thermobacillus xylanilyticus]|uniref:Glycoside hydrolase family 18, spore_hydrolase Cortical-lytic enzyme, yvbX n=2 Tax=Thermobacillus xylanilyticus TaxID=76633 RepID=A0ABN7RH71_THEXY|nr:Glycoside hydrolase family 18, spore_hydrolase Cortical fragment-lytic enzyme, yvbX [Thermobacillus xylanilyticus]